jgi:hypothetical protein
MIKRTNPNKTNKQELLIELTKIRDKQIPIFEKNIVKLKELKSKIIDLKVNVEDTFFNQIKLIFNLAKVIVELEDNGVNSEKLEKLEKELKELSKNTDHSEKYVMRMRKFNDSLIGKLLLLTNNTIIELQTKIKNWKSERKIRKVK